MSARSGTISHNQTSTLTLVLNYASGGSIAFDYKVDSESSFDYLRFYIDGVQQQSWSGSSSGPVSYAVGAGTHTFEWSYSKDGSVNTGSDAAWIDDIDAQGGTL